MEPRHCTNMTIRMLILATWPAVRTMNLDFKMNVGVLGVLPTVNTFQNPCRLCRHRTPAWCSPCFAWLDLSFLTSDAEDGFVNAEEFSCPSEVGLLLCTLQTHRTETCGCVQRGGWPADALFRAHGFGGKGTKWTNMDSIWTQNGTNMHIHHVQTTWCQVAAFLPHVTPLFFFAMVGISVWKRDWPEFEICCFFAWNLWRASNVLSI